MGVLRQDLQDELWIWRPIMAQLVTLEAVKSGQVECEDLLKLNALLDMRDTMQAKANMQR